MDLLAHNESVRAGFRLPDGQSEHNDCTVRALAVAACMPYATAHAILAKAGRKPREGFPFMRLVAKSPELYFHTGDAVCRRSLKLLDTSNLRRRRVATVLKELRKLGSGSYVLRVRRHVFSVMVGSQLDPIKVSDFAWKPGSIVDYVVKVCNVI